MNSLRIFLPAGLTGFLLLFSTTAVHAFRPFDADPVSRVALGGFDPVAYLETGEAIRGAPIFFVEWGGVFWRFKDKANQRKFEAEPERFLPEVGGYCAAGFAMGLPVRCDPTQFAVHEGRLYVFVNKEAREAWLKDPSKYIEKARQAYESRVAAGAAEAADQASPAGRG